MAGFAGVNDRYRALDLSVARRLETIAQPDQLPYVAIRARSASSGDSAFAQDRCRELPAAFMDGYSGRVEDY